jgi:catechol 2,3-dioxygenase-like lactoylglutathione lyase family enzyme
MIRGIHHAQIMIPAGREDEARRFYCGLLGLSEIAKPPALAVRGGFWLAIGAQQMHVGVEKDFRDRSATREHVAYLVDDLPPLRARLHAAGFMTKEGDVVPGFVERCELRDPFGNRVELLQESR